MRILLLLAAIVAVQFTAQSQSVTLLTFENYVFADHFETYYGSGKVSDGFSWGAGLEFGDPMGSNGEIYYQRLDADAKYNELGSAYNGKVGVNYVMLGGTHYSPINEKVAGFGSLDLGVGWADGTGDNFSVSSAAKFSVAGRGGVRIAPSEKFSIRLGAQLMIPLQWFGAGVWFGSGGGGTSVSGGTTIVEFGLGGSVNYAFR